MAELTNLETKLGECIGLAMAAQLVTERVAKLAKDEQPLVQQLKVMQQEAAEAEKRATEVAASMDGKRTKILTEARSVKKKGQEMMKTYLERDSDALDGFEFMTMAEAGEVGHWQVLDVLSKRAGNKEVRELVRWQLPIQKRHLKDTMAATVTLASEEDPNEPA
jgi:hypothetical protein